MEFLILIDGVSHKEVKSVNTVSNSWNNIYSTITDQSRNDIQMNRMFLTDPEYRMNPKDLDFEYHQINS